MRYRLLLLIRRPMVALSLAILVAVAAASGVAAVTAGNGLGAYVSLGFNNTIGNYATSITAAAAKNAVQFINTYSSRGSPRAVYAESRGTTSTVWANNTAGGPALALTVTNGAAPLRVTNPAAGTAPNLSADKLDGLDSSQLMRDDLELVTGSASVSDSTTNPKTAPTAVCPAGKHALGGGGAVTADDTNAPVVLSATRPTGTLGTGWTATALEIGTYAGSWSVRAFAICATATP